MSDASAPPHMHAGRGILMAIAILGALVATILTAGGVYLATAERFAETSFKLFSTEFASTSVGVSMAFIGAVLMIIVFRSVLKSLRYLAQLP